MKDEELMWSLKGTRELLNTPIFRVIGQEEESYTGVTGEYIAFEARDWVITIPVLEDDFVMVRQFRHATGTLSTEFPGGVMDAGEQPADSAARELREETGFVAGKMKHLASLSPNAALFKNRIHIYLAEDLKATGKQDLDADEFVDYMRISRKEVIRNFGEGEYSHGLMATALAFYLREQMA